MKQAKQQIKELKAKNKTLIRGIMKIIKKSEEADGKLIMSAIYVQDILLQILIDEINT